MLRAESGWRGFGETLKLSYVLSPKMNVAVLEWGKLGFQGFPAVRLMVPFGVLNIIRHLIFRVLNIIRHLIFRVPKKGP